MMKHLGLAAMIALLGTAGQAASLLDNGDFSAGNTGFSTDLTFSPGSTTSSRYFVGTNPNAWFSSFSSFGDNTTGDGNMMMVNGSTTAGDTVWSQTVAVAANTTYEFSGFMAAMFPGSSELSFSINSLSLRDITGPATTGTWDGFSFDWTSGSATTATVSLLQKSTGFVGNDYALDDLSFVATSTVAPVPLPAAGWGLIAALGCLAGLRRSKTA